LFLLKGVESMKKILFAVSVILFFSAACLALPASVYNGEPTTTVKGEIVSVKGLVRVQRVIIVDDSGAKTTIDYQVGTTPFDSKGNWPIELNSKVVVTYFLHSSGRNVATSVHLQGQPAPEAPQAAQPVVQAAPQPSGPGMYAEKSEYANKRVNVLVAKKDAFGNSNWLGATNLSAYGASIVVPSVDHEWMIMTGNTGTKLSDEEFLAYIGDNNTLQGVREKKDADMGSVWMWGTWSGIGLLAMVAGAAVDPMDFGVYMIGLAGFAGGGTMAILSYLNYQGYHITLTAAAEKARNYNLKLKAKLGLPKEYEPGL
jgi:hypothetical protein